MGVEHMDIDKESFANIYCRSMVSIGRYTIVHLTIPF
jgi:hypothetical protein